MRILIKEKGTRNKNKDIEYIYSSLNELKLVFGFKTNLNSDEKKFYKIENEFKDLNFVEVDESTLDNIEYFEILKEVI